MVARNEKEKKLLLQWALLRERQKRVKKRSLEATFAAKLAAKVLDNFQVSTEVWCFVLIIA